MTEKFKRDCKVTMACNLVILKLKRMQRETTWRDDIWDTANFGIKQSLIQTLTVRAYHWRLSLFDEPRLLEIKSWIRENLRLLKIKSLIRENSRLFEIKSLIRENSRLFEVKSLFEKNRDCLKSNRCSRRTATV